MGKSSSGFRLLTVPLRRVDCGCYVAGGRRAGARIQDSGQTRPRHTCRRLGQFWVLDSYCQTLCRLSHTFLRYRPFRLSTLDPRLPQEGGEFQIRLARLWISDCPYPGHTAHCRLLTAYCLLPTALFGILGAAEVMRVFQSEFFDASQKYDELSALASCWLWVVS